VNGDTYIFCKRNDCSTVPLPPHTHAHSTHRQDFCYLYMSRRKAICV